MNTLLRSLSIINRILNLIAVGGLRFSIRVSEALVLGKLVNGIILVIRLSLVDANGIKLAKERLERSGQNVLGIVVNGTNSTGDTYEYYY